MAHSPKKARPVAVVAAAKSVLPTIEAPTPVASDSSTASSHALAAAAPEIVEAPAPLAVEAPVAEAAVAVAGPNAEAFEAAAAAVEAPVAAVEAQVASVASPAAVAEIGDNVRALMEKGLVATRTRISEVKVIAEEASVVAESSLGAARDGVIALNLKAIDAIKLGANANFDFLASLSAVKSMSELVTLHSEFARKRFEETASQVKDMTELARKAAEQTVAPIQAHVAKTFKAAI